MTMADELGDAVRAVVRDHLGAQMVLDGVIVVEVLHDDEPDPVLHRLRIGDLSPWAQLGMLRAAGLMAEDTLRGCWIPDDESGD